MAAKAKCCRNIGYRVSASKQFFCNPDKPLEIIPLIPEQVVPVIQITDVIYTFNLLTKQRILTQKWIWLQSV